MRTRRLVVVLAFALAAAFVVNADEPKAAPDWSMNATIIEACSCPMFCQCYFNSAPAGHTMTMDMNHEHGMSSEAHYCKFNNAFRVTKGMYGTKSLDGTKFWGSGAPGRADGVGLFPTAGILRVLDRSFNTLFEIVLQR